MNGVDAYLAKIARVVAGMDRGVREDILRELRSHILESAAANGGNVGVALAELGDPVKVGRGYLEMYGYGRWYRTGFAVVAVLLAIPTVPVLQATEEALAPYGLSVPVLLALTAWVLWVSVRAGSRTGLIAGSAACAGRVAALAFVAATQPGASALSSGLGLFLATSAALVVLGWLPGTARKAWSRPQPSL